MHTLFDFSRRVLTRRFLVGMFFLAGFHLALAQPAIIQTVPANLATGVTASAPVVFTFSTAMDTTATSATFLDLTSSGLATVIPVWSAGNTVLTCTPLPAFGSGHNIEWFVSGQDTLANLLNSGAPVIGSFTTGSGGGGSGNTNLMTGFAVGRVWEYNQISTAAPLLDTNNPYIFSGVTGLASNRTATAVTLTLPTAAVSNLVQNILFPWEFYMGGYNTNLATFNATFPSGNYIYNVTATASNQQVTVNLPNYTQPNAPQISNYAAAQAVNPSLPFTLTWNAFNGGGSTDYVEVVVGGTLFETPGFGLTNALHGTATSVTIPAGIMAANSNYLAEVGFYHAVITTNGSTITEAYVASVTSFNIATASSSAPAPVFTNAVLSGGTFGFDILTSTGQTVTVIYTNNLKSASSTWPILLTTNSTVSKFHISDPHSSTNPILFYRARNGS